MRHDQTLVVDVDNVRQEEVPLYVVGEGVPMECQEQGRLTFVGRPESTEGAIARTEFPYCRPSFSIIGAGRFSRRIHVQRVTEP